MTKNLFHPLAQRTLIAGAVLAMTAGFAQAQSSVTLYGRIDVGVQYSNKTAGSNDSLVEVANAGIRPSIWGLRGSEDLGGGLGAFFNLEAHFAGDTGAATGPAAGRSGTGGFRRQANVGVKGPWGQVTLGRQYSPAILANIGTEPRAFKENLSGLYPYALNQNPGSNTVNDVGLFIGNSVSYSNTFGPVYLGALVAAGEGTGRTYTLGASWTGPITLSASYQEIQSAPDQDGTKHGMVGAAVPFGPVTVKASYQKSEEKIANVKISDVNFFGVGVDFAWNPTNTLNATYYYGKDKIRRAGNLEDKTSTLVLSNDYAISKRTTLYVQGAYADAKGAPSLRTGVIVNGAHPDAKTSMVGVGVSHNF